MRGRRGVALAGVLLLAMAGCENRTPTAPDRGDSEILTGTWVGEVDESTSGRGRLRLTIEQTQFALTGTFQLDFDNAARNRFGSVSGTVDAAPLARRMQWSSSTGFECAPGQTTDNFAQVAWTRTGNRLTGTYTGFGCAGTFTGSFDIQRQ
jgi:hypothetical protein